MFPQLRQTVIVLTTTPLVARPEQPLQQNVGQQTNERPDKYASSSPLCSNGQLCHGTLKKQRVASRANYYDLDASYKLAARDTKPTIQKKSLLEGARGGGHYVQTLKGGHGPSRPQQGLQPSGEST